MICSKCGVDKESKEFYKNSSRRSGLSHYCKPCKKSYIKAWVKTPAGKKSRYKTRRDFYLANKDYELSKSRQWRRGKRSGTPPWLTEDHLQEIARVYGQARDCSVITGEPYEVDHIVPINGVNVCGLHVPWNLQVLPKDLNAAKGNKHITS